MSLSQLIRDEQAKITAARRELDNAADDMASALLPRLRRVSYGNIIELKKALREFNAHRKFWK